MNPRIELWGRSWGLRDATLDLVRPEMVLALEINYSFALEIVRFLKLIIDYRNGRPLAYQQAKGPTGRSESTGRPRP